jgi:signal transduction histidine kinase
MVEATARNAMAEMRRLFGVLREEGESASLAPQPGLSELPRLVESVGVGGPRITLEVVGEEVPLPPGVDLAAYRIAQEGLTNALRHARARRIEVTVGYGPGVVEVRVADDGRGLHPNGDAGHGLVGIRERAALYDGTVELTDAPGGGVVLAARLSVGEPA